MTGIEPEGCLLCGAPRAERSNVCVGCKAALGGNVFYGEMRSITLAEYDRLIKLEAWSARARERIGKEYNGAYQDGYCEEVELKRVSLIKEKL
jgi:hypothetical protein